MLEKGERRLREIEYLKNLAKPITASELGTMFGVCRTTASRTFWHYRIGVVNLKDDQEIPADTY